MIQEALFDQVAAPIPPKPRFRQTEEDKMRAERMVSLALMECVLFWKSDEFDIGWATTAVNLQACGPFEMVGNYRYLKGDIYTFEVAWALTVLVDQGKLIATKHYLGADHPAFNKGDAEYRGFRVTWRRA